MDMTVPTVNPTSEINVPARSGGTELCGALPGLGVLKSGLTKTKTDRRVLKSGQTKTDSGHVFFEIRSNNARFRTGVCLNPGEQRTSPDRCFLNPGEHGRCPDTITKYE
jgi:hypothetical protein